MKKRLFSLALALVFVFGMLSPAVYADDSVSFDTCTHEWETPLQSGYSITIPGTDVTFGVRTEQCKKCKWYKHVATIFIGEFTYYSPFNVDAYGIVPVELTTYWVNVWYKTFGQNATATKAPTGIGRKDLPGYADDKGSALVDKDGWPTATYTMLLDGYDTSVGVDTVYQHSTSNSGSWWRQITGSFSGNGGNLFAYGIYDSTLGYTGQLYADICYYYIAPVSGYYTLSNTGFDLDFSARNSAGKYILGEKSDCRFDGHIYFGKGVSRPSEHYKNWYPQTDLSTFHTTPFIGNQLYFNKGDLIYFSFGCYSLFSVDANITYKSISIKSTAPTLTVQDLTPNQITNNNNITINNNTWNGNIYVDNSTNLTYIYPEYTTINENNETVTNISENPIIYNNETKQYYTYDSVTNNYYYITYEQPATPTPSPTPNPGENPTPTPTPGGGTIVTPGGDGSGSSSGISGGDDEGLFGWLWDLLKDLVKAILKAIFKVLSGLLGFLIWLVERVGILLPFLPAPAIAALGAGVVLVFVIRIIRFIRG